MSKGLVQNYTPCGRSRGTTQTRANHAVRPNVKVRQTIRLVRGNKVIGERCQGCSGYTFKVGKGIQPTLSKEFKHPKGCKNG